MDKKTFVHSVLGQATQTPTTEMVSAFAPTNIALCKYWGKRDVELNLPVTSSLSIALPEKGTTTVLTVIDKASDEVVLNGQAMDLQQPFAKRITDFLNLFRQPGLHFHVETRNNIPSAAGLASSASGFAALVEALNLLFNWQLDDKQRSLLARIGSGSACRSFWQGFVEWHRGESDDGLDSYAEPIKTLFPSLRLGLLITSDAVKSISSREAMLHCQSTSFAYSQWPAQVAGDLQTIKQAIQDQNFTQLAQTSESNALAMHAIMLSARPSVLYWNTKTHEAIQKIWQLRKEGLPVYFTQDAGANLKLLFEVDHAADVKTHFPELDVITPFLQCEVEQ